MTNQYIMEDQESFFKLNDPQKNELVFYAEDDTPICTDITNLIVFDCNEDSQSVNFGKEVPSMSDDVITTVDIPSKTSNDCARIKNSPKRWCQKDVTIKTIESEFKVVMWVLDDQSEQIKTESPSRRKQDKIERVPIAPLSKPKVEASRLTQRKALPRIKCTIKSCRMSFKDVTALREHLTQHATENSNPPNTPGYLCSFENCSKRFKDITSLRKHLHTHGPKTKICAECGKAFIDNSKLSRHLLVHSGEKPFKCWFEGCGKRFSLDFNLRTHARIHTGYRPFACTFDGCKKRFVQSTNLKSHQMIHMKNVKLGKLSDDFM